MDKDVVNKLQNYNSLSAQEQIDITRAVNTKKRLEKPSAFNILAPIKFEQDFVDFNTFDAGQNYSFSFDASSINFNNH